VVPFAAAAILAWWALRMEPPRAARALNLLNYDLFAYYYPTFHYAFEQLRGGHFPLWDPYQLCGTPFFALGQHLLLYPLNTLYLVLPTAAAMKWTAIGHLVLGWLFTYLLVVVLGLSRVGAATAATAFALAGSTTFLVYVPHHLYGAVWIPLVLALTHLVLEGRRRLSVALGVVLACQYLGGYPLFSLFSAYVAGGYWGWWIVATWGRRAPGEALRATSALAGAAAVAGVLAAVQLLPARELATLSPRSFGELSLAQADPLHQVTRVPLRLFLRDLAVPAWRVPFPRSVGIGLVGLALALWGAFDPGRRRVAGFFVALAVLAFLLGLGSATPLYPLYFRLPTGSWFRLPARFFFLTSFALAVLAGCGVDRLAARGLPVPLLLALPAAVYLELFVAFANVVPLPSSSPDLYTMPADLVRYLRESEGTSRVYLASAMPVAERPLPIPRIPPKAGMMYGLLTVADRENLYSERFARWAAFVGAPHGASAAVPQGELVVPPGVTGLRFLDLMSVGLVVDDGSAPDWGSLLPLARIADGVRVYRNPDALPHAYVVTRAEVLNDPRAVLGRLAAPDFAARTAVVLEEEPPGGLEGAVEGPAEGAVRIVGYAPEEVTIDAAVGRPALLVLTDQWYPGWEATVDGASVRIYRANYLFRAVALTPGAHRVVFHYRPSHLGWLLG